MGRPVEALENRIQINQMKPHHRSMARDCAAMGEIRPKDLAKIYHMTPSQISIIVNSPVFQAELARLETMVEESVCDVRSGIRLLTPRAEQVLKEELFQGSEFEVLSLAERKLRLGVAMDVLDRDSGRKVGTQGGIHFHNHHELHLVKEMSSEELRKDVFDLIAEE